MRGVVVGNEVLDATPVRRFKWQEGHPNEVRRGSFVFFFVLITLFAAVAYLISE